MTKSTPIHQLQQSNTATPPSAMVPQVESSTESVVNVEHALQERESFDQDRTQQVLLQEQIDLLKMQLSANASKGASPTTQVPQHPPPVYDNPKSDSLINKSTLIYLGNNFDYKLFIIVFILSILIYSSSIREYLFTKLDDKKLAYLHPYVLAGLVSLGVSVFNKI